MTPDPIKGKPVTHRLTITEGMTTDYVRQHGNTAQVAAISVFDKDANGVFDKEEAQLFNSVALAHYGDELRIYERTHKKGENAKLLDKVDLKKANADYQAKIDESKKYEAEQEARKAKMDAREKKLAGQLAPYGIQPHMVSDIFDNAQEKTINGKKCLVLTSEDFGYELTLPLDSLKNPSQIYAISGGEGGPTISGVKGTLKQTKTDGEKDYYSNASQIYIENSDVKFIGKYGNADTVILGGNAQVEFVTDDWADQVWSNGEQKELQPGTYKFPENAQNTQAKK